MSDAVGVLSVLTDTLGTSPEGKAMAEVPHWRADAQCRSGFAITEQGCTAGEMSDAAEVLNVVTDRLDKSPEGKAMAESVFGCHIREQRHCKGCGSDTRQKTYCQYLYTASAAGLREQALMVETGDDGRALPVEVSPLFYVHKKREYWGSLDEGQQHNHEAEATASESTLPLQRRVRAGLAGGNWRGGQGSSCGGEGSSLTCRCMRLMQSLLPVTVHCHCCGAAQAGLTAGAWS